jgi:hypothetical protein
MNSPTVALREVVLGALVCWVTFSNHGNLLAEDLKSVNKVEQITCAHEEECENPISATPSLSIVGD